jgi:hypothetical protein
MMRFYRGIAAILIFLAASGGGETALAQSASGPDKSQYTLFNPVPDNLMRDFNTDRPPKANVPYTVDAGHFQYETDIVNFADQWTGSARGWTLLAPNPTLKAGLTSNTDIEVNFAPVVGARTQNAATGAYSTAWGIGDLYVRGKVNIWGNDGGNSAGALITYIKAPTAPSGIGNGATEGGVIAPFAINLPGNFTLLFNPEIDALKDNADGGRHANFINLVTLGHPVVKDVTLYVELWTDYNNDPIRRTTQASFDTAIAWMVRPNLQLDFGADIGLTSATPNLQVFAGISQRF